MKIGGLNKCYRHTVLRDTVIRHTVLNFFGDTGRWHLVGYPGGFYIKTESLKSTRESFLQLPKICVGQHGNFVRNIMYGCRI